MCGYKMYGLVAKSKNEKFVSRETWSGVAYYNVYACHGCVRVMCLLNRVM